MPIYGQGDTYEEEEIEETVEESRRSRRETSQTEEKFLSQSEDNRT